MRSVRQDPKVRETLGEAIRPQPEWWLNGDPFVKGQVRKHVFSVGLALTYHVQIGQLQGNIDVSFRIKGSKGCYHRYYREKLLNPYYYLQGAGTVYFTSIRKEKGERFTTCK